MSPALQRTLRSLSAPLVVVLSLAVAATLAWLTHRAEVEREVPPTACSRAVDEAFGIDAAATPDSLLLQRLLVHRDRCIGDATYTDQARRLMLNLQRVGEARALLDEAERHHALTEDELAAELAWVDLEESRLARANGDTARATEAESRAIAAAERLVARWPEWSLPYRILGEARRTAANAPSAAASHLEDPYARERAARRRVVSGAIARSLSEAQAMAVAFVASVLGMLGFVAAVSGLAARREMMRMTTAPIASAKPGYVELVGTLHLLPKADPVIGPLTKAHGVWYSLETNLGSNGSRTFRERSAQSFILRDASGEAAIDPTGMTVQTRHSVTRFGNASAITSSRRVTERMLREGDEAFVLGELALVATSGGAIARRVRIPEDGRRLLVSNYSEQELMRRERIWLWCGVALVLLSATVLTWGFVQRFQVLAMPGVLP